MSARRGPIELGALVLILGIYAALFVRTTRYDFVWDDVPEIATSPAFDRPLSEGLTLTQTQRAVPELAQLAQLQFGYDSYRPLLFASYWCDVRLWGRDPGALHRTNVLLGAIAILLAYLVARRWLGSPFALVPTALFALHPVQVETVAYISARGDLLAGLLGLAAAYAALRAQDAALRGRAIAWTAGAAVAFAASLLAKESGVALPLAVAAMLAGRAGPRRWWIPGALALVAAAYVPIRGAIIATPTAPPYAAALIALPGALLEYARIAALPFDLSIERAPREGYTLIGWLVAAVLGAAALWRARRGGSLSAWSRVALGGGAWAIALLGPSTVALRTMAIVADRYAYVALFGVGVAAAAGCAALVASKPRIARIAAVGLAVWACAVLTVTWRQVPVWQDAEALYRQTVELAPDSSRAHYRVAVLAIEAGRWDAALPELTRAIALDPQNVDALNNLGVYQLGVDAAAAEATLQQAVRVSPQHFRAWLNLGLAQIGLGRRADGCASIARALAIDPGYARARQEQRQSCSPAP